MSRKIKITISLISIFIIIYMIYASSLNKNNISNSELDEQYDAIYKDIFPENVTAKETVTFKPTVYDEDTYVLFYMTEDLLIKGIQVDSDSNVLEEYTIDAEYPLFMEYSHIYDNDEIVFFDLFGRFETGEDSYLLGYNYKNGEFVKKYLPISEEYKIRDYTLVGKNLIFPIQNSSEEVFFYDYTNDILYDKAPVDMTDGGLITIGETEEKIYFNTYYDYICEYDKVERRYKKYDDTKKYYKAFYNNRKNYETIYVDKLDRKSPYITYNFFYPTYNNEIIVNPYGIYDYYKITDDDVEYAFTIEGTVREIFYLNDEEVIITYKEGPVYKINNETYEVELIADGKSDKEYIENYVYNVMYEDDEYIYVTYRLEKYQEYRGNIDEEQKITEILLFDKDTYEFVNKLTFNTEDSYNFHFKMSYLPQMIFGKVKGKSA